MWRSGCAARTGRTSSATYGSSWPTASSRTRERTSWSYAILTATTTRVSTACDGAQVDGDSSGAVLSPDGRRVVLASESADRLALPSAATHLVRHTRVHAKDLRGAMISADGRRVAYDDGNRYGKPYVFDRVTGETSQLWPVGDTKGVPDVFIDHIH